MFQVDHEASSGQVGLPQGSELSVFGAPAYPLEDVFDPTGAGDSFAGGFMGYLAGVNRSDAQAMRQAIIFGSVMASFSVEKILPRSAQGTDLYGDRIALSGIQGDDPL